jgi:hypothetical protein
VASLLEAAGLSRSNPTHIVPQGRVMALTTMADEARLDMLREVSGMSACAPRPQTREPRASRRACSRRRAVCRGGERSGRGARLVTWVGEACAICTSSLET